MRRPAGGSSCGPTYPTGAPVAFSTFSSGASARCSHAERVLERDLVGVEVAAQERDHVALLRLVDEALDHPRGRDAEELDDVVDAALAGGRDLDHRRLGLVAPGRRARARLRLLEVGAVAARGAAHDRVLARVGEDHELLGRAAADRARVGLDDREVEAAPLEDPAVGGVLRRVGAVEARGVRVERVAVVHQELAPAHQAEARTDLVAELRADLVERDGKLPVGGHSRADHRRDGLLGGRREAVLAVLAVRQVEEDLLLLVARPAAALLPQLARLEDRQLDLEGAGAVDLLAHDRLGLAVRAQAERRQRVDAGGDAADHPGARQEDVGDRLRVARDLADGLEEVLGPAHWRRGRYQTVGAAARQLT